MTTWAKDIYENMISGNSDKIYSASNKLVENMFDKNAMCELYPHLPQIISATKNVELGGALFPNNARLDLAIKIVEFLGTTDNCPCYFYTNSKYPFFNPQKEQLKNHITILEETIYRKEYYTLTIAQCNYCKTKYKVVDRDYHYIWWEWKLL